MPERRVDVADWSPSGAQGRPKAARADTPFALLRHLRHSRRIHIAEDLSTATDAGVLAVVDPPRRILLGLGLCNNVVYSRIPLRELAGFLGGLGVHFLLL